MRYLARRAGRPLARAMAVLSGTALLAVALPAAAAIASDWPAYLNGPLHSSYSAAEKAITPASARGLVEKWHFAGDPSTMPGQPGPDFLSSPTVADGAVFIGSGTGWFYKLSQTTGAVLDKVFLGYQPTLTCTATGFVDTATVAADPVDHQETVYVGGPDGYLYALSASNLSLKWKSVIAIPSAKTSDYFEWSSPTVANGKIYIGLSSNCDDPLIRGGVIGYNQATGTKFAQFYTVPKGAIGGSVWSSVAVAANGDVYATTGNGPRRNQQLGFSESIIKLTGSTLKPLSYFKVPRPQITVDSDFGGSPTIFGRYVGACNKNGVYYTVKRSTMKLAWQQRVGRLIRGALAECAAAAVYNGRQLYLGGTVATIRGKAYRGSVQERNPANGQLEWETGLSDGVIGSPTMDRGGVIAVGTYDNASAPNAVYLVNAATGKIARTLIRGSYDFAQSVFARGWLFTANGTGVYAWGA
jgi:outer membrane protein assembly factor BamB